MRLLTRLLGAVTLILCVAGILGGTLAGFVIAGSGGDSNLPNLTLHSGQRIHLQLGEELTIPGQ